MNPKELRIVFMGTPEFAVPSLRALVAGGYNVVAVVTTPDKPAGRGQKLHQSEVKLAALELGLPVLQPEKLKAPEFVEAMQALKPDLGIVIAFRMLPEVIWPCRGWERSTCTPRCFRSTAGLRRSTGPSSTAKPRPASRRSCSTTK